MKRSQILIFLSVLTATPAFAEAQTGNLGPYRVFYYCLGAVPIMTLLIMTLLRGFSCLSICLMFLAVAGGVGVAAYTGVFPS